MNNIFLAIILILHSTLVSANQKIDNQAMTLIKEWLMNKENHSEEIKPDSIKRNLQEERVSEHIRPGLGQTSPSDRLNGITFRHYYFVDFVYKDAKSGRWEDSTEGFQVVIENSFMHFVDKRISPQEAAKKSLEKRKLKEIFCGQKIDDLVRERYPRGEHVDWSQIQRELEDCIHQPE